MQYTAFGVHIKTKDFESSRRFYERLGFKKIFAYGPSYTVEHDIKGNLISVPEAYNGMTFEVGSARLEIADGHKAVKPHVFQETVTSSKISLMITVDTLSSLLTICKQNKISIAVPPRHYYWGTLEMVIKDPDGVVLVFICPYSPEEAKKIKADETYGIVPR